MTSPLAYLATPYTKYPQGPHIAFRHACKLAAQLLQSGVPAYSPIAHTHPIALHGGMDHLDLSIWLPFDELMMACCDVLIVAHMEGWQESTGVAHEIDFFLKAGKPIFDLDPATMQMVRRWPAGSPAVNGGDFVDNLALHGLAHNKTPSEQGESSI